MGKEEEKCNSRDRIGDDAGFHVPSLVVAVFWKGA
jgi:hypothetical protein